MPMLTVRLSDEEMARLKELAGGNVAALVRVWIAASGKTWPAPERIAMPPHMDVAGFCQRDGSPWPCAAAILAPPEHIISDFVDVSTMDDLNRGRRTYEEHKPSFLAAPDEDCVCGHDRHSYHLGGACSAFIRPKTKCPCPGFQGDLGFD